MSVQQQLESLAQDLRKALRGLRRSPRFTLAAGLAVALGVGPATAVFSVVDRILFRSLPYPQADRLVSFGVVAPIVPQEFLLGYDYLDWRESQAPFESLGAWAGESDCDLTDINPIRLRCGHVDSHLLPTLGVQPPLGRNFTAAEDSPNGPRIALISYGLWRSRFAADPAVVGKSLPLDGHSVVIVGVLPPQFETPTLAAADVLLPLALDREEQRTRKTAIVLYSVGRLKPGVTRVQAAAALQPLFAYSMQWVSPEFRKQVTLRLRPLRDLQIHDTRLASWILLMAVAAVLAIACANVANLLLARAAARRREFAVRVALGAGRGRLIRYTLMESLMLSLTGGAAGCALAFGLLRLSVAMAPGGIPRLGQAALDVRVLLFALAVSVLCGILFGLAPAFGSYQAETLAGWRTVGTRHHVFRLSLVALQVALSLVLLTGAGLLLRSLRNLQHQSLGLRTDRVITAAITLGQQSYPEPSRRLAFFEQLEARLRAIPGVTESALSNSLPPSGNMMGNMLYAAIDVQGRPRSADPAGGSVLSRSITPRYFAALGIPVLRGRGFTDEDRDPGQHPVILSDTLARRMFPGEDPLGKQIRPGRIGPWLTVIGVVADVKNNGLVDRAGPEYYEVRSHSTQIVGRSAAAIVRTSVAPTVAAQWLRRQIASLDPTLPVDIATFDQRISHLSERPRFSAALLGVFAATGLFLAAIGLYGVVGFLVAQRTQEIGVRIALGATPAAIARLVLLQAARWTAVGAAVGTVAALYAARLLRAMLYQVSAYDPLTILGVVLLLSGVALLGAWLPSRRAAHIDPVEALRQE